MGRSYNKQIAVENESDEFLSRIPGLLEKREESKKLTCLFTERDRFQGSKSEPSTNISVVLDDVVNVCNEMRNENAVVLNFASAYKPTAQEEVLCRASTLFYCLNGNTCYNQQKSFTGLYEHNAIYSPNVPFFRDPFGNIVTPYTTSVISMAAPNAKHAKNKGITDNHIQHIMHKRIGDCKIL